MSNDPVAHPCDKWGCLDGTYRSARSGRSGGDFLLVVWNEDAVADGGGNNITPAGVDVILTLGTPATQITTYDPTIGTAAQTTANTASTATVTLHGYPHIFRVTP